MEFQNNNYSTQEELSFSELFFHYLSYWKWFLISICVFLFLAFIYLRYTTKEYQVSSKVLIKDEQRGQTGLDMNAFSDLGLVPSSGSFDNELEILSSKSLMKEVVDSLKLGVTYFKEGRIKQEEIYKKTPVFVTIAHQTQAGAFTLDKGTNEGEYSLKAMEEDFSVQFTFNEEVHSPWGTLTFQENPFTTVELPIVVVIHHPNYLPYVSIAPLNKATTVVNISITTPVPEKGTDIINTLVSIYNQKAISEKNYVAYNTIKFINERLVNLSGELEDAEKGVENYKRSEGLTDIEAEASLFLGAQTEYTKKISDAKVQIDILRAIKSFIMDPQNIGSVAPANVGLSDPTILSLIQRYNDQILEKNTVTSGMTPNNPILKEFDDRILLLRENLIKGINISESSMQTALQGLQNQEGFYYAKNLGLSTQERESRELYRQKDIKETLYLYLLQKSEEIGLSLANATPNALVIDPAEPYPFPIKPKRNVILLACLLLGIIIPTGIIYIQGLFDNKLRNKDQLKRIVTAPFLGDVPEMKKKEVFPVLNARSAIAEKFRIVSSNLSCISPAKEGEAHTIMVTSSFSGEGKSFFSLNLAMSLAISGKKTLLIDLDIHKSLLKETLDIIPSKGITTYLSDTKTSIPDIIHHLGKHHEKLDILPVEIFPPNPAELLASKRLDQLFEQLKKEYDYLIVDAAPIGLVADAYRINQLVDAVIYVTRVNYTPKSQLSEIQLLYKENKLNHLTTIINSTPATATGRYGYSSYMYNYNSKNAK